MDDLENERIFFEIRELVKEINSVKTGVNNYCLLVKQMILSASMAN